MRRCLLGLLLLAPSSEPAGAGEGESVPVPARSRPKDLDLDLDGHCPGLPDPAAVRDALAKDIRELVLLWPRAGTRQEDGACQVVARVTALGHKGVPLSLSRVEVRPGDPRPEDGDRELLTWEMPRRRWVHTPDPALPAQWVEIDGALATGKETVESVLDHMDGGRTLLGTGSGVTMHAP